MAEGVRDDAAAIALNLGNGGGFSVREVLAAVEAASDLAALEADRQTLLANPLHDGNETLRDECELEQIRGQQKLAEIGAERDKAIDTGVMDAFNAAIQQQAEMEAAARCRQAADWSRRTDEYREQEWAVAQKLLLAAHCFLENLGDREVEKMSLAQVSRALEIYARLARHSLSNASASDTPPLAPLQVELAAALKKAFGSPPPANPQN